MNIEMILLIVILTFGFAFVLDRWGARGRRNTRPITMRFGPTFRSGGMRPADGPSNGSEALSRIRSGADYTIAMLESSFRKRQQLADRTRLSARHLASLERAGVSATGTALGGLAQA